MHKILMVCMGNLCRSPMAAGAMQGILQARRLEHLFEIDSAGTHAKRHVGQRPDPRAVEAAARHGCETLSKQRARLIGAFDFEHFDLILAMDSDNLSSLRRICLPSLQPKLHLLLDFADNLDQRDIPDPYFGNAAGFERVMRLCEAGATGLINRCLRPLPDSTL